MITYYPQETFREVETGYPLRKRYAVSNRGRQMSFVSSFDDGVLLNGGNSDGFKTLRFNIKNDKGKTVSKTLFIYRLVAQLFIPKQSDDQTHVIHLDYSRDNDRVSNLRWATPAEAQEHRKKNPKVMDIGRKVREYRIKADGRKLDSTKVIRLKKMLNDPNRKTRLKILAKQFGISEMQVCRIKRGENWGHIKV